MSLARHALRSGDTNMSSGTATCVPSHFVLAVLALLLELSHSVYIMLPVRRIPCFCTTSCIRTARVSSHLSSC